VPRLAVTASAFAKTSGSTRHLKSTDMLQMCPNTPPWQAPNTGTDTPRPGRSVFSIPLHALGELVEWKAVFHVVTRKFRVIWWKKFRAPLPVVVEEKRERENSPFFLSLRPCARARDGFFRGMDSPPLCPGGCPKNKNPRPIDRPGENGAGRRLGHPNHPPVLHGEP
jgi:hypothetical protein